MTGYTQRGQLGLFLPTDYKPAPQKWTPCPPAIRAQLAALRDEFAQRAEQTNQRSAKERMRY